MQSLAELAMEPLEWRCAGWGDRSWELHAASALLGTLRLEGVFRITARAETDTGQWHLTRTGFFGRRIEVHEAGAMREVASVNRGWLGRATVRFATGREIAWEPINFWTTQWAFLAEHRQPLVEFGRGPGFLKRIYTVKVVRDARGLKELPILVTLGLFLLVLRARSQRHS
jgi:hypothetical protein